MGIGLAWHQGSSQIDYDRPWLPPGQQVVIGSRQPYPALTSGSMTTGVDLRLGGRHVAVVPSFRARRAFQGEDLASRYPGGFPRWTLAGGACVRIDF